MKKESIALTKITGPKLADQLIKFGEIPGYLSDDITKRLLMQDIHQFFATTPALKVHKSCYDNFNRMRYERALAKPKRSSSETVHSQGPPRTRKKSGKQLQLGEQLCIFCDDPDQYDPKSHRFTQDKKLHAAAGKLPSATYVESYTTKIRNMAVALSDPKVLSRLNTDVRASEIYYHNSCYALFVHR